MIYSKNKGLMEDAEHVSFRVKLHSRQQHGNSGAKT